MKAYILLINNFINGNTNNIEGKMKINIQKDTSISPIPTNSEVPQIQ